MGILVLIAIVVIIIWLLMRPQIPSIHTCRNVKDVVMAINYGRVYPYFTGMSLEKIRQEIKSYGDIDSFERDVHMQELVGHLRGVKIPCPSDTLIDEVYLSLNNNKVISSITIGVSCLNIYEFDFKKEMHLKFGTPTSFDNRWTWRDGHMTITLDFANKFINIMDERLPRKF